jgi:hypothetical protein
MTSSIFFDRQYGVLQRPMAPTRFGNWLGWVYLHWYGLNVKVWSPERFPAGHVLVVEKTMNDDLWSTQVEQTKLVNGDQERPDDFIQGVLSLGG